MKKHIKAVRICCTILGTALILLALLLVVYNVTEDRKSGERAAGLLYELKQEIPEYSEPSETWLPAQEHDLYAPSETAAAPVMETAAIDGMTYIGYLSIPALSIELPVLSEWSYPDLKLAPCRYRGTLCTDDLIICAHNYASHFGTIGTLRTDDEIDFTDVNGKTHRFAVTSIEQLPGTAAEDMQFGSADDWDLTLFTCTLSGRSRVTVRAVRSDTPEDCIPSPNQN